MADINIGTTIKDCKISFLHYEYTRYSQLIHNQTQHIEVLYKENILSLTARNNNLRLLSELIKFMNNDVYNVKINEFKKMVQQSNNEEIVDIAESTDLSDNDEEVVNIKKVEEVKSENISILDRNICDIIGNSLKSTGGLNLLLEICKNSKLSDIGDILFDDFDKVKNKLLEICKEVGFYSIDDALNILVGNSYKEYINYIQKVEQKDDSEVLNTFKEKLELFNMVFIPVEYRVINNAATGQPLIKSEMEWQLTRQIPNSDIYIDTFGEVTINFVDSNKTFVFGGYFINDPIHTIVRTSQICRYYIYKKKKLFQSVVDQSIAENDKYINGKFANIYIKNMNLGDILSYDEISFKQKMTADYLKYVSFTKMKNFKHQMDEFNKDNNLKNMYNIIRLMLMGPDECINIAGLLFGLTKEKKYNAEIISELIYRKLSYPLQIQLKKSSINLKNELEKFLLSKYF